MLKKEDKLILMHLRKDARISLAEISRSLSMPISTVFERIKKYEKGIIKKYYPLLDFSYLGYLKIAFIVKAKDKQKLKEFLLKNNKINSVFSLRKPDFFVEAIFSDVRELNNFVEKMAVYSDHISEHHIVEELKKEEFLTEEKHFDDL